MGEGEFGKCGRPGSKVSGDHAGASSEQGRKWW